MKEGCWRFLPVIEKVLKNSRIVIAQFLLLLLLYHLHIPPVRIIIPGAFI